MNKRYKFNDLLKEKSDDVVIELTDAYKTVSLEKMEEYEKTLEEQEKKIFEANQPKQEEPPRDNTVLWTIVIIGGSILVIAVLGFAIFYSSDPKASAPSKKYNVKSKNKKKKKK